MTLLVGRPDFSTLQFRTARPALTTSMACWHLAAQCFAEVPQLSFWICKQSVSVGLIVANQKGLPGLTQTACTSHRQCDSGIQNWASSLNKSGSSVIYFRHCGKFVADCRGATLGFLQ